MNIQIAIRILKELKNLYEAESTAHKFRGTLSIPVDDEDVDAIETLLTAYEKEKENNKEITIKNNSIKNESNAYGEEIVRLDNQLKAKNQEIEYLNCIIESDKDNYINKNKIKPIQIIDLDGKIHNVYKIEKE